MSDKIIIDDRKRKHKEGTEPGIGEKDAPLAETTIPDNVPEPSAEHMSLDENVWDNDLAVISKLDEQTLADRRLFVRIRHMRRVICKAIFEHPEGEPVTLKKPLDITISDLSMGGIGIICEEQINIGKILLLPLILDSILYEVKCEVVYCIRNDDKFRIGLRIIKRDKQFIRHLKIFIARISLENMYGSEGSSPSTNNGSTPTLKKN